MTRLSSTVALLTLAGIMTPGCEGQVGVFADDQDISEWGAHEPGPGDSTTFANHDIAIGAEVEVCESHTGVNLRSGPGTNYLVLRVVRDGATATTLQRSGDWYRVDLAGTIGWFFGQYLCPVDSGAEPAPAPGPYIDATRAGIIQTARSFVGFSYWYGGARLNPESTNFGQCLYAAYSGHSGPYGTDCSGFVSKVWQLPAAMPFETNLHPFSSWDFYYGQDYWASASRGAAQSGDALVQRTSTGGHVVIFESGDPWGSFWTYEARGCAYGVVHNLRLLGAAYQLRQRDGA